MSHKKAGSGDDGKSRLSDGTCVYKNDPIFEFLGDLDEINSLIGSVIEKYHSMSSVYTCLNTIQTFLLDIGSHISNPKKYELDNQLVMIIEKHIIFFDNNVPKLTNFILPRGDIHPIRAVVRRAERHCIPIIERIDKNVFIFLNRLSDLLFGISRYTEKKLNNPEIKYNTK